ncbi:MAG: type II secretion system protein [Candidatus Shapirobacteria bacterium]|jgi:prepilin-type N-terminal cleavage/methylation domain-containing protein
MNKYKVRGFTLFELLVSISIIGILMALISFSFSSAQRKARDARRMQDLSGLQKAAEQYYGLANANYPANCSVGVSWAYGSQTILEAFPLDPKGVAYTASVCSSSAYCVCGAMEGNATAGNSTGACVFSGIGSTGPFYCVKNQQ